MQNAMIYSENLNGHRQVYVFVIATILYKLGYKVVVVANFSQNVSNSFYIDQFKLIDNLDTIDIGLPPYNGIVNVSKIIKLQKSNQITISIFSDADHHISLFNQQLFSGKKKLIGRNIGIFIRPFYFYHKHSIWERLKYIINLRNNWRFDARLFHEFFSTRFNLLNCALHIDDNFASFHKKVSWIPDVFQQFADKVIINECASQRNWIEKINDFKSRNNGNFIVLYFGTANQRKGYDVLLKLADDNNACFIHCGLNDSSQEYNIDVENIKKKLEEEDRLLETNEFISDPLTIEWFFKSTTHLVLPYRNFLGSSGIMLQALGYGVPVLVPDYGLMGFRVKKYNLGLTFSKTAIDLNDQFLNFIHTPIEVFANSIRDYMKIQSVNHLEEVLSNVLKKAE